MVTLNGSSAPTRLTVTSTVVPFCPRSFLRTSSCFIPMADSPFIFTSRSPDWSPTASEGDPSITEMTYKYPINLEELKNINGVGEGKANKFGHDFISLIKGYVNENNIERPDDVKLRTSGAKSGSKLSLIQNIDKKIPLDEIINSKVVEFSQLLFELESIVFSGTKLNIDYYINDILDEDQQLDLHEYFIGANNEDVSVALQEFDGEFDEDEIRLYRIKFISDIAN